MKVGIHIDKWIGIANNRRGVQRAYHYLGGFEKVLEHFDDLELTFLCPVGYSGGADLVREGSSAWYLVKSLEPKIKSVSVLRYSDAADHKFDVLMTSLDHALRENGNFDEYYKVVENSKIILKAESDGEFMSDFFHYAHQIINYLYNYRRGDTIIGSSVNTYNKDYWEIVRNAFPYSGKMNLLPPSEFIRREWKSHEDYHQRKGLARMAVSMIAMTSEAAQLNKLIPNVNGESEIWTTFDSPADSINKISQWKGLLSGSYLNLYPLTRSTTKPWEAAIAGTMFVPIYLGSYRDETFDTVPYKRFHKDLYLDMLSKNYREEINRVESVLNELSLDDVSRFRKLVMDYYLNDPDQEEFVQRAVEVIKWKLS